MNANNVNILIFCIFINFFLMCKKGTRGSPRLVEGLRGSPRFLRVRLGDGKKVPESPMESPAIWGRFRGVPKSPEPRNVGNG